MAEMNRTITGKTVKTGNSQKKSKACRLAVTAVLMALLLSSLPSCTGKTSSGSSDTTITIAAQTTSAGEDGKDVSEAVRSSGENETEAPGGDETEAPGSDETEAPGGDETEAPGSDETEAPGGDETQAPGEDETQAPGDDEPQAPEDDEPQAPGGDDDNPTDSAIASGTCGEKGTWRLLSDNTLVIKDETGEYAEYSWTPWDEYNGQINEIIFEGEITEIGSYAFKHIENLTSIIIPDSVTSIGWNAFYGCTELESIYIPASVTYIGVPFAQSWKLKSITVAPDNPVYYSESNCIIEKSGKVLVAGCSASVIPDGVTAIGEYAFAECHLLKNITIPDSVTSIGGGAFAYCQGLTDLILPDSVKSIGGGAFEFCGLGSLYIPSGVSYVGGGILNICGGTIVYCGAESQPAGWEKCWNDSASLYGISVIWGCSGIGYSTYDGFSYVVSNDSYITILGWDGNTSDLIIPDTIEGKPVTTIMDYSRFSSNFETVTIPASVTSIGECFLVYHPEGGFYDKFIRTVYYKSEQSDGIGFGHKYVYGYSGRRGTVNGICYAVGKYNGLETVYITGYENGVTDITVPESIEGISRIFICDCAFCFCDTLESVTLSDSVLNIGNWSFSGCIKLSDVKIGAGVKTIGISAFSYCNKLEEITIPGTVETVRGGAFQYSGDIYSDGFEYDDSSYLKTIYIKGRTSLPDTWGYRFYKFEDNTEIKFIN